MATLCKDDEGDVTCKYIISEAYLPFFSAETAKRYSPAGRVFAAMESVEVVGVGIVNCLPVSGLTHTISSPTRLMGATDEGELGRVELTWAATLVLPRYTAASAADDTNPNEPRPGHAKTFQVYVAAELSAESGSTSAT